MKSLAHFEVVGNANVAIPKRASKGSACYDLTSTHDDIIPPNEVRLIKTGLTAWFPSGLALLVCSRSGLALKHNVYVLNACGVVDSDYYPNEIGVILRNDGKEPFIVNAGDRIAQAMFTPITFTIDDSFYSDERIGGFGSSGTKDFTTNNANDDSN